MSADEKGIPASLRASIALAEQESIRAIREDQRRANRYPEAIRLMKKSLPFLGDWVIRDEFEAFLAEEPRP